MCVLVCVFICVCVRAGLSVHVFVYVHVHASVHVCVLEVATFEKPKRFVVCLFVECDHLVSVNAKRSWKNERERETDGET